MAYGTVKVDNITFDNSGSDQNVTVSGLYNSLTSGITVTGTISGTVVIGSTSVSGTTVAGITVTGTTVQGASGTFTSLTGTTIQGTTATYTTGSFTSLTGTTTTGTTANFVSGVFSTSVSGATVIAPTGTFTSLTGTTIQGTTATYTTGSFTSLTGTTTTGTTATYTTGSFTSLTGTTTTGTTSSFTSGVFTTLSGATATFTSGIISSGRLLVGTSTAYASVSGVTPYIQLQGTGENAYASIARWAADTTNGGLIFNKSRGASVGTRGVVAASDGLGEITFAGDDGTNFIAGARIQGIVDGTPGANDMPGRLVFSTTADGASTPTEQMRIRSDGNIGIGGAGNAAVALYNQKDITGNTTAYANWSVNSILSDVTTSAYVYRTQITTAAAAFTVANAFHYAARQIALGASSVITNQYGFQAENNLTGATNNYGFHGNLAAATGRWNFYANGTADSYFASNNFIWAPGGTERARIDSNGRLLVGTSSVRNVGVGFQTSTGSHLFIEQPSTGLTPATFLLNRDDSNGPRIVLGKSRGTAVGSNTIVANDDELGRFDFAGADGTDLESFAAQIKVEVDGTPGANDMPGRLVFSTTADGASTPTERLRIRSDGNIGIGGAGSPIVTLYNQVAITGGAIAYSNYTNATIQSDVTSTALGYTTSLATSASAFTLSNLQHFIASQGVIGAGSTVTSQYGFIASASLTGATNNYGFYGNIASATGRWNFYAAATAPNYFAGDVRTNTVVTQRQAPANSNTSVTLTAASILDGLRTGTPAGNINYTLPTGTNVDAAFQDLQTNQSFEWSVINLAAAVHVITVVANTDHTVVGNMAVAAATSGRFLTRKTAANTFISYRIA